MKKIGAILLLIGFLSSSNGFREILRLPLLVVHYWKHQSEKPEITVLEFFIMHYANDNIVDEDYEQDMKLPFKTFQHTQSIDFVFHNPQFQIIQLSKPEKPSIQKEKTIYSQNFLSSTLLKSIWQPPRC